MTHCSLRTSVNAVPPSGTACGTDACHPTVVASPCFPSTTPLPPSPRRRAARHAESSASAARSAIECVAGLFRANDSRLRCAHACHQRDKSILPDDSVPRVVAGSLHLPELHSPLPCDVYLWCGRPACPSETPAPQVRSYTGQPVAEIHTIGSPPLLQMMLRALCAAGARLAGPGEFTLRAFLAGRIDLTQAEAVLGVIDADDGPALDAALGQLAGGLARPLHRLRDDLLDLLAHVEAGFDFADEDLPFVTREELDAPPCRSRDSRRRHRAADEISRRARRRRSGRARRPAEHRQEQSLQRPRRQRRRLGLASRRHDARLPHRRPRPRRREMPPDRHGRNSKRAACGFALSQTPSSMLPSSPPKHSGVRPTCKCSASIRLARWTTGNARTRECTISQRRIVVLTKCDAARDDRRSPSPASKPAASPAKASRRCETTCAERSSPPPDSHGDVVASTAARCRESLRLAGQSLQRARSVAQSGQEELAAAEIRVALDELGKVVGAVYTDDILDRIFSRFCIGK